MLKTKTFSEWYLNKLKVGRELGGLGHLGRDGMHKVSNVAGRRIVSLHRDERVKSNKGQRSAGGDIVSLQVHSRVNITVRRPCDPAGE
jgi:hypothetical protein